ncbi:MAG: hypothetical protein AAGJ35_04035, partial [Myxococcota bacterium]
MELPRTNLPSKEQAKTLVDAIKLVAQQPSSLEARMNLAIFLQKEVPSYRLSIWEALCFLAAAHGDLFHTLMFLHLHMDKDGRLNILRSVLRYFLATPSLQTRPWQPNTAPRTISIPKNLVQQHDLAYKMLRDLSG